MTFLPFSEMSAKQAAYVLGQNQQCQNQAREEEALSTREQDS
jgi:hypothetical protein